MAAFDDMVERADRAAMALLGGAAVTYTPNGGPPVTTTPSGAPLLGMFDEQYVLAKASPEAGAEATAPAVFLRVQDLPVGADLEDDALTITILAVAYRVLEVKRDGFGGVVLVLRAR